MKENKLKCWIHPHSGLFIIEGENEGVELVKEDLTAVIELVKGDITFYSSGHVEIQMEDPYSNDENYLIITNFDMGMSVVLNEDEQKFLITNIIKLENKTASFNEIVGEEHKPKKWDAKKNKEIKSNLYNFLGELNLIK